MRESGPRRHIEKHHVSLSWLVEAGETLPGVGVVVSELEHVIDVMLAIRGADVQRTLNERQNIHSITLINVIS